MPIHEQAQAMCERNEDHAGIDPDSSFISGVFQREILRLKVMSDSGLGREKSIVGSVLGHSFTSPTPEARVFFMKFGMRIILNAYLLLFIVPLASHTDLCVFPEIRIARLAASEYRT